MKNENKAQAIARKMVADEGFMDTMLGADQLVIEAVADDDGYDAFYDFVQEYQAYKRKQKKEQA